MKIESIVNTLPDSMLNTIQETDTLTYLRSLPDRCVNCIVTSPPYWGLRDYGVAGQIGLEPTYQAYVATLVQVFNEAQRVLRDDGVLWLNLGDSYAGAGYSNHKNTGGTKRKNGGKQHHTRSELPEKNLIGIPWRVAFALQDNGWILRSDCIWHKPNTMPESVQDRPTKSHEYIFLFSKSPRYWYDADAVRQPQTGNTHSRGTGSSPKEIPQHDGKIKSNHSFNSSMTAYVDVPGGRNLRTVWSIHTQSFPDAHFATFPPKLIEPMILAGCPEKVCSVCGKPWKRVTEHEPMVIKRSDRSALGKFGRTQASGTMVSPARTTTLGFQPSCKHTDAPAVPGVVLDPFMGSGTTALVARALKRNFIGCELNPKYIQMAQERLRLPFEKHYVERDNSVSDLPLFSGLD